MTGLWGSSMPALWCKSVHVHVWIFYFISLVAFMWMWFQFSSQKYANYGCRQNQCCPNPALFWGCNWQKDWSKRAWAEWCTMEKGLHPESMATLSEVGSTFWELCFLLFMFVMLIADSCFGLLTHAGSQILLRFCVQEWVIARNGWNHCEWRRTRYEASFPEGLPQHSGSFLWQVQLILKCAVLGDRQSPPPPLFFCTTGSFRTL